MLFGGSIQENIGWGENQHEIEKIQKAAAMAEIEEEILAKPGGFSSPIAPGGVGVSEGQKQRLLIARMLYRKPAILVLDEATCHLDPIAEEKIISRIFDVYKDQTVIFFTQRIHLTMKADRIFYLEEGRVVETGTHQELIQKRKKYYEFFILHLSLG
jgi:ATP-binding cassette subfamily B protein